MFFKGALHPKPEALNYIPLGFFVYIKPKRILKVVFLLRL